MKLSDLPARIHRMDDVKKAARFTSPKIPPSIRRAHKARARDIDIASRERKQLLLEFIRAADKPLTSPQIQETFGWNKGLAVKYLRCLIDDGFVHRSERIGNDFYYKATSKEGSVI